MQVQSVSVKRLDWTGRLLVDVTNARQPAEQRKAELRGLLSSEINSKSLAGAKLVKAFNHLRIQKLGTNAPVYGQRHVVFVSSEDGDASAKFAALAKQLGFAPLTHGWLDDDGLALHAAVRKPGGLLLQNLVKLH